MATDQIGIMQQDLNMVNQQFIDPNCSNANLYGNSMGNNPAISMNSNLLGQSGVIQQQSIENMMNASGYGNTNWNNMQPMQTGVNSQAAKQRQVLKQMSQQGQVGLNSQSQYSFNQSQQRIGQNQ